MTDISFAENNEDTTTNLYDAQFREYGIQGRWPSPDPAGIAAANPANPQSWNRYAYVLNNPLALTDPTGKAAGLRPEYYEYNIDVLFMSGDVIGAAEAVGGGGTIAGCDEFDLIDPNSFCNQIVFPILTQTFNVQNWTNYYATNGYSADPCVFAHYDSNGRYTGSYSVNTTLGQKDCVNGTSTTPPGQWVPPGHSFEVNPDTGKVSYGYFSDNACFGLDWGAAHLGTVSVFTLFQPEAVVVSGPFAIEAVVTWGVSKLGGC